MNTDLPPQSMPAYEAQIVRRTESGAGKPSLAPLTLHREELEKGYQWDYLNNKFVATDVYAIKELRDWREEHDHPMYQVPEEFLFKLPVYNLEVEDFHTYYAGELGVWVHNACGLLTFTVRSPGPALTQRMMHNQYAGRAKESKGPGSE